MLTGRLDHGSKESLESAIETAQRADTIVYCDLFCRGQRNKACSAEAGRLAGAAEPRRRGGAAEGMVSQEERADGKKILERIVQETGGKIFEVSKKETVARFTRRSQRNCATSTVSAIRRAADSGYGYHKIHLTTKQKDLTVRRATATTRSKLRRCCSLRTRTRPHFALVTSMPADLVRQRHWF